MSRTTATQACVVKRGKKWAVKQPRTGLEQKDAAAAFERLVRGGVAPGCRRAARPGRRGREAASEAMGGDGIEPPTSCL
jgi:hypothetical protein